MKMEFSNERKITISEAEFANAQSECFRKMPNSEDFMMLVNCSMYQSLLHRALFPHQKEKEKEHDSRNAE